MPSSDYTPDVQDVGGLLRARTVDDDGNELGTFTSAASDEPTRPTLEEATESIEQAVEEIAGRIGADIPQALHGPAKSIAKLLSAMNIELTYFPEQVRNNKSPYEAYERRVRDALGTPGKPGWLVKAVIDAGQGGEAGPVDDDLLPVFYFDDPIISGEWIYDPTTERWILRASPPPTADEGVPVWMGEL